MEMELDHSQNSEGEEDSSILSVTELLQYHGTTYCMVVNLYRLDYPKIVYETVVKDKYPAVFIDAQMVSDNTQIICSSASIFGIADDRKLGGREDRCS